MAKSSAPNSEGQGLPVRPRRTTAVKIGLAYAVMGVLWVSGSSLLLHQLVPDRHQADTLDWVKDSCFALFMAAMLGFLLDRYFKQLRRSAQKLRESEERWKYALEGAGHGVWDWNPQTNEVHYSDQWKQMLGYAPQEIAGRLEEWESRVHPDDLPQVLQAVQRHLQGETAEYRAEHRMRGKDGSYKWILDQGKVMRRAPDGKPLRVLGTHTDISDRKAAEAELAAQKDQLDHFFDSAIDLLCITDHTGRFLRLNQEWEKLLGYSRAEILGRPFLDFVHPEDVLATQAAAAGLADNVPILNFVNRYRAKDGSYRFIEWRSLPSGGLIYATARDVTRRMQLEAALRESEVRQNIAIEAAELGLWEWDLVANKVVWSEQHHRLWGFAPGEFKGKPEEFTSRLHPDDLAGLSAAGDASRSANRPFQYEFRAFIKDGSMRWFASHGRYLFAPDGRALRIVGVTFDITERKLAEEAVRVGRQRLQLAMSAARMGAWEFDFQTNQLQWSDEIFSVLGLAKQPVSREFLGGLIHAEDRELLDLAMQTAIATRSPYKAEYRVLTGGKLFWVDDRGEVQFASDGRPLRAAGVALDITERKMAEQALRLAHDRNAELVQLGRQLAEASSPRMAGLAILEAARQLLGWDCAWLREIDVPNQAWQDLAIFDLVDGERRECTSDPSSMLRPSPVIRRAMTEGQLVLRQQEDEGEQSLVRFGSGRRSLSLIFVPLRHLGKLIGMLSIQSYQAQAYDEAGVKLLQALADHCAGAVERTRVEAALQARQEIFQGIVTQAADAIVLVDGGTGRFLEFNPAAHEGLGHTREEFARLSIQDVQVEDSLEKIQEWRKRSHAADSLAFETHLRHRDGSIREVRVSVRKLSVAGVDCLASLWCDISERKRAERSLQQSAKRAEQEAFRTELLLNLHQLAPQLTDRELYNYVLEKAVQLTESTIGFFHQVSDDQQSIRLTTWNSEALRNCTAAFETHYPLREAGNWVDCVREQRPVVYNDFAHSPNQRGLPDGHTAIRRFMSIPVVKDGKVRIIFGVGNKPEDYGESDKSQLQLVANELHKIMVQREAQHQVHQLSLAVEQSPAMIVITNPRGHVEYVNQQFIEVAGFTLEEMRGQLAPALRAEYHAPEQFQDLWQTIQRCEQWQGEVFGCRKSGERFWETVKVSPIKHPDGTTAHLLVLKEDITQRRRLAALQQALLTLGEKLNATSSPLSAARALFASADEIWKWDSGTLHLLTEDRNHGEAVLQIDVLEGRRQELPPEERIPLSPRMKRVIQQGAELILRDPTTPPQADSNTFGDGTRLSAAIMCVPVRREDTVVGVLSLQSYTPRAYGLEDLRLLQALADYCAGALNRMRSEAALQASEERYRGLVETTLDWVWEVDVEARYTYASSKVLDILGYPPEAVIGKTPFDFMLPEEARRTSEVFQELLRRRAPFSSLEKTSRHSNGRRVLLETSGVPVLDGHGRLLGYRGMDRDVTERRQLEEQLRQAQKLEAIGQLAGGVAHDFNNILAATMMHLSLLQANPSVAPEMRVALRELDAEARRAAALTRQLLAFSRRSVLSVKPLDLNEMVGNLLKMLSRLIGEHIKLTFESGSNLPAVEADAGMMEQVLMNLVVNARDAMPKGGAIEIATSVTQWNSLQAAMNTNRRPGRFVCLRVTDNGMGMTAEILQRIFEPFFTTKEMGKGTGLGLATVHGIVAQHQGWVEVDSAVGKGTAFRVYLPVLEQVALASQEPAAQTPIQRGHETILVVEDETRVRRVLAHLLRTLGYQVHEAANGQEAMKVWQIHGDQIELLFTDMVMPEGMTGLELTEQLQALKPNLKAIISSGYSAELGDAGLLGRAGIIYLPKPYDAGSVAKIIRECLERKG